MALLAGRGTRRPGHRPPARIDLTRYGTAARRALAGRRARRRAGARRALVRAVGHPHARARELEAVVPARTRRPRLQPAGGADMTADRSYFGKYRATVLNNVDPQVQGRIQVQLGDRYGLFPVDLGAAGVAVRRRRAQPGWSRCRSSGRCVWVEFEAGDPDYPIWTGAFWPDPAGFPPLALAGATPATPNIHLQTTTGDQVTLSDNSRQAGFSQDPRPARRSSSAQPGSRIMNGQGASIVMVRAFGDHQQRCAGRSPERPRQRDDARTGAARRRELPCPHGAHADDRRRQPAGDGRRHARRGAHRPGDRRRVPVHGCSPPSRSRASPPAGSWARPGSRPAARRCSSSRAGAIVPVGRPDPRRAADHRGHARRGWSRHEPAGLSLRPHRARAAPTPSPTAATRTSARCSSCSSSPCRASG